MGLWTDRMNSLQARVLLFELYCLVSMLASALSSTMPALGSRPNMAWEGATWA